MEDASYFQLLNPIIMVLFSSAFYLIHKNDPKSRAAPWYMFAYVAGAIGFTLDFAVREAAGPLFGPYISNIWLLAIPALITCGIHIHCGKPLPWRMVSGIYAMAFVVSFAFHLIWPVEVARVMAMNSGAGLLAALSLPVLFNSRHKPLARLLFVLLALTALQMLVRPLIIIAYSGLGDLHHSYSKSLYAVTLHFTSALCAISIAATLMFSLAIDMVRRLNQRSDTDSLTGVLNRRGFEKGVDAILSKAERSPLPISLIVSDIDHFKRINDTYGHAAGDKVISAFGQLLRASMRKTDCIGRVGGEEFCIILWNSDGVSTRMVAEGLRTKLNSLQLPCLPDNEKLSASFGVAQWQKGMDYEQLFATADAALLKAKRNGRDRVEYCPKLSPVASAA